METEIKSKPMIIVIDSVWCKIHDNQGVLLFDCNKNQFHFRDLTRVILTSSQLGKYNGWDKITFSVSEKKMKDAYAYMKDNMWNK